MTVRFTDPQAEAIDKLRKEEGRTRANMVKRIIDLWFAEHRPDLLPPPDLTPGS